MNFVIAELIERVEISKGPVFCRAGRFATAGVVNLVTRKSSPAIRSAFVDTLAGLRALAVASPQPQSLGEKLHPWSSPRFRAQAAPFTSEDYRRATSSAKSADLGPQTTISLSASSYGGSWNASDSFRRGPSMMVWSISTVRLTRAKAANRPVTTCIWHCTIETGCAAT